MIIMLGPFCDRSDFVRRIVRPGHGNGDICLIRFDISFEGLGEFRVIMI